MSVSKKVAADGECERGGCDRYVQTMAHHAEHHCEWEKKEPCESLDGNVDPEDIVDRYRVVGGAMSMMSVCSDRR